MPGSVVGPAFAFEKKAEFLAGGASASITIDASLSPAVALAIEENTEFPEGTIRIGTLAAKASGGSTVQFGGGARGAVSFTASGGLRAGLGVYSNAAAMFED